MEAELHLYEVCEQYVRDGWRDLELDLRSDLAHCQRKCQHFQKYALLSFFFWKSYLRTHAHGYFIAHVNAHSMPLTHLLQS